MPVLNTFSKKYAFLCIDYKLQLVFFQHAPLNLWGYNYIIIREIIYDHATILSCLINFPSIQSDFKTEPNDVTRYQLEYPAKKLEKGFTFFENVFSIYLTTKNMALHMHFKAFLHIILGKVFLMNCLDVSNLFVKQNMSYLLIKMHLRNINTNLDYQ